MLYSENFTKFKNIKHCFYTRNNGFSGGVYKSLNCGLGSQDKQENIIKNLSFVAKNSGVDKDKLKLMSQTHSNKVIIIDKNNINNNNFKSDALITKIKNIAIGVLTADCVPVILYDEVNQIIGCIHAGWKGAISGIVENTLSSFATLNNNNKIYAAIGPCIGKKSYQVGNEFYLNFLSKSKENDIFFIKINNKFYFNIRKYVENKLLLNGVFQVDNIDLDTFQDSQNFYSYRKSRLFGQADYGRCISTICLKN